MHVDRRRTGQLQINVMILACAAVAGRHHGMGIEIDPAHERYLGSRARVDQPGLLVLAESGRGTIPPNADGGINPVRESYKRPGPEAGSVPKVSDTSYEPEMAGRLSCCM